MNNSISGVVLGATRILAVLTRPFATDAGAAAHRIAVARALTDRLLRHARQAHDCGLDVFAQARWLWREDAAELGRAADEIAGIRADAATCLRTAAASILIWGENVARAVKGCDESRQRAADAIGAAVASLQEGRRQLVA